VEKFIVTLTTRKKNLLSGRAKFSEVEVEAGTLFNAYLAVQPHGLLNLELLDG
jgi:hypothetical protein